ncbi:MAG: hypothetical protein Fur006_08470 [Coleofasciculaceae cyanobacterium]
MPGTPVQEKGSVNTKHGSITINSLYVVRDEAEYEVVFFDFPKSISLNSSEINKAFDRGSSNFAKYTGGRIVSQRNIRLGNFPGREVKFQFEQGWIAKRRAYLVSQRVYGLTVYTDQEASLAKSIDGFFKSFRLANQSTASQNISVQSLNTNLQRAICNQNWSQAINVVNQMIASTTNTSERNRLTNYRNQLQNLANSKTRVSPSSLSGCTTR